MAALIVLVEQNFGIAKNGTIPWSFPQDRIFFHQTTQGAPLIVGRKTFLTLPQQAFANKTLLVLSRTCSHLPGVQVFSTLEIALMHYPQAWIIGGAMVYYTALSQGCVDRIYLTRTHRSHDADLFLTASYLDSFSFYLLRSAPQADFLLGLRKKYPARSHVSAL
ncbi:MAG: dihydrofolate reductase [Holosporales bacterium]|jgi:dihydrofolate reductase|nr:dihydrofolate reductase [Holosporales bacterium]